MCCDLDVVGFNAERKSIGTSCCASASIFPFLRASDLDSFDYLSKNLCINQVRAIHAAVEQWANSNAKEKGDEVNVASVIEFAELKHLPECPDGGPYRIGRVGDTPRCAIAEHNLER
jgi:hypothetical protein